MKAGIFIPRELKPYPKNHELLSARALVKAGYSVVFLQPDSRKGAKTADILLNGVSYEMKSPIGSLQSIERNLKRANRQSPNIIFDSRRMKIINTKIVEETIRRKVEKQRTIKSLLFINRHGKIIDLTK